MASHDCRISAASSRLPSGRSSIAWTTNCKAVAKTASATSSRVDGQGVDVGAIHRGDEGPVERLVDLGDDAVGLVLDLVHPLDDRLAVGVASGRAAVGEQGADLQGTGGARSSRSKKCSSRGSSHLTARSIHMGDAPILWISPGWRPAASPS